MRVEFDPAKAAANLRKHRVSFADAESVLHDPLAITITDPVTIGEHRYVTVVMGSRGEMLVVVHAERDDVYRLISARKASRKERASYEG